MDIATFEGGTTQVIKSEGPSKSVCRSHMGDLLNMGVLTGRGSRPGSRTHGGKHTAQRLPVSKEAGGCHSPGKECVDTFCVTSLKGELMCNFLKRFPEKDEDSLNLKLLFCSVPSLTAQKTHLILCYRLDTS